MCINPSLNIVLCILYVYMYIICMLYIYIYTYIYIYIYIFARETPRWVRKWRRVDDTRGVPEASDLWCSDRRDM